MHLSLVMPPQQGLLAGFANALVSLANYVRRNRPGISVDLIDLADVKQANLKEKLRPALSHAEESDLIVGITTTTASYQAALLTAEAAKMVRPSCTTIFGGHHVTGDPETVLKNHEVVDYALLGEGERSLVQFLDSYPDVHRVRGLAYMQGGSFHRNAPAQLLSKDELDKLPGTYSGEGEVGSTGKFEYEVTYVSARGCPLGCAFCAVGNQAIRHKSTEQIVKDVRSLVETGAHRIAIEDNFFAHSRPRTKRLCRKLAELQSELNFSWDCQTRIESLNDSEVIRLMAKAGCEAVFIGVESLTRRGLRYLNKTNDPSRYLRLLHDSIVPLLLNSPITCNLNLQFGLPVETTQSIYSTLDQLEALGKRAIDEADREIVIYPQLHVVYPGTEHFREGVAEKRFTEDVFESFTKWETDHQPVLEWLGEHFAHGTGGLPEGILEPAGMRTGDFKIDASAVLRISTTLRRIEEIDGIQLFKYGKHLVRHENQNEPDQSPSSAGHHLAA